MKQEVSDDNFDVLCNSACEANKVSTRASASDDETVTKEAVCGENTTMNITILNPTRNIISRITIYNLEKLKREWACDGCSFLDIWSCNSSLKKSRSTYDSSEKVDQKRKSIVKKTYKIEPRKLIVRRAKSCSGILDTDRSDFWENACWNCL